MMILKKPTFIFLVLSLVTILILAVPQSALAVPGVCPEGYTYLVKFNWSGSGWVLEEGDPTGVVFVTGDALSGTWTANALVDALVISDGHEGGPGGPGAPITVTIFYNPPVSSGTYNAAWMLPPQNPTRNISNLVFCGQPFPITLASFTAQAYRGTVSINWTTATEINTAGFLVYRSSTADAPQVKIAGNLIAAEGSGVSGASYGITDTPRYGTYYYWLEDVDYSGQSSLHGPVVVNLVPAFRLLPYRPSMPVQ
jgi:hypothetical protein